MWNDLGLKDKARMMELAVKSGIKDLRTIEEVYNYASGGEINKFEDGGKKRGERVRDWFTQATLRAAMADRPEIMQASGWDYDKDGNIVQGDPNAEGPARLAESLAEIASVPMGDMVTDVIGAAVTGTKLYKTYRAAKELKKAIKATELGTENALRANSPIITSASARANPITTSTKSITGRDIEVQALRERFNKWAEYYGYDKIPNSATVEEAEKVMKKTFDRHNTFFRGLQKPFLEEDIEHLDKVLGEKRTYDETMAYMATHGRPDHQAVYVSPTTNAAIYGGGENTAIVRRNYTLGENPKTWLQDADFDIVYGNAVGGRTSEEVNALFSDLPENEVIFPWSSRGHNVVENEILIPSGRTSFVGYVPKEKPIDFIEANGSLNKYLGNEFVLGRYDTGIPLKKPTFASGGPLGEEDKQKIIERVNSSNAEFVERLKDPNRKYITNPDGSISTHRLGYATEDDTAIVYPEIQNINDTLKTFPTWQQAFDSAVARGDTLHMSIPEAEWFTTNYKNYYPQFNYADGGGLSRSKDYKSSKKPYPSVKSGDFAGGGRSYPIPTKADAVDALRLAGLHHRPDVKAKVYSKYPSLKHADGGPLENESEEPKINKVVERRNYNGVPTTLESYKQQQRDSIVESAVERALTRDIGVYPKDEAGNVQPGCIYTATDNFGKKYRVSGNQTFFVNPEKYGFIVNGPVENARVGDLYQMFERNTPSHMTLITGYDNSGEPLVSYESGYIGYAVPEEVFNSRPIGAFAPEDKAPDYDGYRKLILQEQKDSYRKNVPLWEDKNFTGYETYRFVGTPEDNARWEQEFGNLPTYLSLPSVHNKLLDLQKEYRLPTLTKK